MTSSNKDLVRRFVELFNREGVELSGDPPPSDVYELLVKEPVLVPMRASLDHIEYSGPTALADFQSASAEIWTHVQIEPEEIRELDSERLLLVGTLQATGRESGVEVRQRCAWLIVFRDGKIAEARTYMSEREALEAAA